MIAVRFKRQWGIYNGGDVASFPEHVADALCSGDSPAAVLASPANSSVALGGRVDAKRAALEVKTNKELSALLASAGKRTDGKKSALIARLLGEEE